MKLADHSCLRDLARPHTAARIRRFQAATLAPLAIVAMLAAPGLTVASDSIDPTVSDQLYAIHPAPDDGDEVESGSDWQDDADWLDDDLDLEAEYADLGDPDPLERMNRGVFAFNEQVDRWALTPITDIYQAVVPQILRKGIANAFANIDAPVRITNALLQGRPKASGIELTRFVTNSTLGLGGLFEAGERVGLEKQSADFGMTLARWGTPQGPYMIFPLLGPTTLRDGMGMGVDFMMQPVSWVIGPLPGIFVGMGKDFSRREQHFLELTSLRDASLDFYASLRSAFLQDRAVRVSEGMDDAEATDGRSASSSVLDPATFESRCLAHPRSRREMAKPALRAGVRARCQQAADAL
jgi:phospholipid-binding lipoprotein MlaA